jgi:hypothetical protein
MSTKRKTYAETKHARGVLASVLKHESAKLSEVARQLGRVMPYGEYHCNGGAGHTGIAMAIRHICDAQDYIRGVQAAMRGDNNG